MDYQHLLLVGQGGKLLPPYGIIAPYGGNNPPNWKDMLVDYLGL